ncbi:hypothetical protein [Streptomyces spiralis]
MTHSYLTVVSALAALLFVTAAALRLILKRITARTALALAAIAAGTGTGCNIAAERWPWDLLGVIATLILITAWATTPTKRERARDLQCELDRELDLEQQLEEPEEADTP